VLVTPSILPTGFFEMVPDGRDIQAKGLGQLVRLLRTRRADDAERQMRTTLRLLGDATVDAFHVSGLLGSGPAASAPRVPRRGAKAPHDSESSAEAVARHVRELIAKGQLEAGQRLPQDEIALAVGVSRIPVREAIIALEREGWLRVENHRGAFVLPLDKQAITDRFALYGRYYGFAARRAIERMMPGDLDALDALADDVGRAKSPAAMERATTAYLAKLVSVAGSNRLRAALRSTSRIVPGVFFAAVPSTIPVAKRGIAAMHAAVVAGDADAAEKLSVDMQDKHGKAVVAKVNKT
jgi:DNA-binding GntR family transcriptional regulator